MASINGQPGQIAIAITDATSILQNAATANGNGTALTLTPQDQALTVTTVGSGTPFLLSPSRSLLTQVLLGRVLS